MKKLINGRRLGLVRRRVRPIGPVSFRHMATFQGHDTVPDGTRVYMGVEAVEWSHPYDPRPGTHIYEYWQKGRR